MFLFNNCNFHGKIPSHPCILSFQKQFAYMPTLDRALHELVDSGGFDVTPRRRKFLDGWASRSFLLQAGWLCTMWSFRHTLVWRNPNRGFYGSWHSINYDELWARKLWELLVPLLSGGPVAAKRPWLRQEVVTENDGSTAVIQQCNNRWERQEKRKGIKTAPLLSAIDIPHLSMPMLHLVLGVVNKGETCMVWDIQAVCEKYTPEYMELEWDFVNRNVWPVWFFSWPLQATTSLRKAWLKSGNTPRVCVKSRLSTTIPLRRSVHQRSAFGFCFRSVFSGKHSQLDGGIRYTQKYFSLGPVCLPRSIYVYFSFASHTACTFYTLPILGKLVPSK